MHKTKAVGIILDILTEILFPSKNTYDQALLADKAACHLESYKAKKLEDRFQRFTNVFGPGFIMLLNTVMGPTGLASWTIWEV